MQIILEELKKKYNHYLNRYYNGCNYVIKYPETFDKYIDEIMKIKDEVEFYLEQIMQFEKVTEQEILNGFTI